MKLHLISNVNSEWFQEKPNVEDVVLPDADIIILTGNYSNFIRRTMNQVENLAKMYPEKQFVLNLGMKELTAQKNFTEIRDGVTNRQLFYENWPKNLHFKYQKPLKLEVGGKKLDILCLYGFPHVAEADEATWKNTEWYQYTFHGITHDQSYFKPKHAADVYHGHFWIWSTPELCREDHKKECEIIKNWIAEKEEDSTQILVTALSPINDPCLEGINYTMYPDLHPDVWVFSGVSANLHNNRTLLHGNPGSGGEARSVTLDI